MFLTGAVPSEQKEELHVIIEEKKEQKVQKIDTTANEIQKNKKRQDLRQYVMQEYSNILGSQGLDHNKMKGNKYYQNHLKALELMREQEKREDEEVKIKIMQTAELMAYDDDFDEEEMLKAKHKKYTVGLVKSQDRRKEATLEFGNEDISDIQAASHKADAQEDLEEDDDMLDNLDRFIEGADVELVKDHSDIFEDDEKVARRKKMLREEGIPVKPEPKKEDS